MGNLFKLGSREIWYTTGDSKKGKNKKFVTANFSVQLLFMTYCFQKI